MPSPITLIALVGRKNDDHVTCRVTTPDGYVLRKRRFTIDTTKNQRFGGYKIRAAIDAANDYRDFYYKNSSVHYSPSKNDEVDVEYITDLPNGHSVFRFTVGG